MAKKTPEEKITELTERQEKIERELKQKRAAITTAKRREQAKITNQKRADNTRRKILIGATVQQLVNDGRFNEEKLTRMLDQCLDRDTDRDLFGLPPRSE